MQMDLWYRLAVRDFSDVTERANELLEDAEEGAEETAEAEPPVPVPVDFF
jgi:hypothetical protein